MSKAQVSQINVHPLVLLSIVDHFNRVNLKQRSKRVVGALLGEINDDTIEVVNCYGLPFEEDPSQTNIWFLDHLYHETMFAMMKKVHNECMLRRSVRKKSSWDGTQPVLLSRATMSRSTKFSPNTQKALSS